MTRGRILILVVFAAAVAVVFLTGVKDYLTLDALSANRSRLLDFVAANAVQAVIIYMAVYIAAVALSVPGAVWLTIAGGFVFGPLVATLYIVVAATVGATIIFLIARYVLGDVLRARAGPALQKMEAGFQANALSYLLILRLVPLFPFFVVNLAPAFLGVSLRTYVIATLFGIIPGTFVYALAGNGLGVVFDAGGTPDLGIIFKPGILFPILGLALLALIPVVYKRMRRA